MTYRCFTGTKEWIDIDAAHVARDGDLLFFYNGNIERPIEVYPSEKFERVTLHSRP